MLLTISPSKRSLKISFQTSPEVRHQFRRKKTSPTSLWKSLALTFSAFSLSAFSEFSAFSAYSGRRPSQTPIFCGGGETIRISRVFAWGGPRVGEGTKGVLAGVDQTPASLLQDRVALAQKTLGRPSLQLVRTPVAPLLITLGLEVLDPCSRHSGCQSLAPGGLRRVVWHRFPSLRLRI